MLSLTVPLGSGLADKNAGSLPVQGSGGTYLCPMDGPGGTCWNPGEDADGTPVPYCECIGKYA